MGHTRLAIGNRKTSSRPEESDHYFEVKEPKPPSHHDAIVLLHARAPGAQAAPCTTCMCRHTIDKHGLVYCPDLDAGWISPDPECYLFTPPRGQEQLALA